MTAIHRHEIPVDDQVHELYLTGPVLHVATRRPEVVEVWALAGSQPGHTRHVRVFGTGQPLPRHVVAGAHLGTAVTPDGQLVWHLFEVMP